MFELFIQKVLKHKKIAVFSHLRPDGDCIGSQVALCRWLQVNDIQTTAFNEDPAPDNLQWLLDYFPVQHPKKYDLKQFDAFIVVDGNALHRFGSYAESLSQLNKPVYMIDHHPDPDTIFEEAVSDTSISSTAELIFNLYSEHDASQMDSDTAKALFTGILTDTGSFQFSSVSANTMHAASELMRRGNFTPDEIVNRIYADKPLKQLKLLSLTLNTITLHSGGTLATIHVTKDMLQETGCSRYDTEGFVQYPLTVEGVKACVFLREDDGKIKLSLRSKSEVDVNAWARELNGGGHAKAAGGWHKGPMDVAITEVIEKGEKQL